MPLYYNGLKENTLLAILFIEISLHLISRLGVGYWATLIGFCETIQVFVI
jgi:hypothetical protein